MRALLLLAFILQGCGPLFEEPKPQQKTIVLDGVKLITQGSRDPYLPQSFEQSQYTIGEGKRLLLRFVGLSDHYKEIRADKELRFTLQLTAAGTTSSYDSSTLKVCPVTRPWMMLATWSHAHPYGEQGKWTDGGEIDERLCEKTTVDPREPSQITFDITRWYQEYPVARNQNYGLILISESNVTILGDKASQAPRMIFYFQNRSRIGSY